MESNVYFFILSCLFLTFLEIGYSEEKDPTCKGSCMEEDEAALIYTPNEDFSKFWNDLKKKKIFGPLVDVVSFTNKQIMGNNTNKHVMKHTLDAVTFTLYSRDQPDGVNFTLETLLRRDFQRKKGLKVVCHGWRSSGNATVVELIKNAYLKEQDVNIIGMDWSHAADNIFYPVSAHLTAYISKALAQTIDKIASTYDYKYEDIHVIGHSLGAHVAGFAGRRTKSKIGRITGLDPALPGFDVLEVAGGRLSKDDAQFVDIIHTCAHGLGLSIPIGHADFYPNGGSPKQPGCANILLGDTMICSHGRSYEYFASSIAKNSDFIAVKCNGWKDFEKGACSKVHAKMGESVDQKAAGIYYLTTSDSAPFYLGLNGTHI